MSGHQEIWCQPADQTKRQFIVMFDDPQMDLAVFDDETEARAYWEKANLNWTCYLMGTMPRSLPAAPNVDVAHPLAKFGSPTVVPLGLYRVHWKSGGSSLAAIGMMENGDRWIAPTNWVRPGTMPSAGEWAEIDRLEPVEPPPPVENVMGSDPLLIKQCTATARENGSIDAMEWKEGEFTRPLYDHAVPVLMKRDRSEVISALQEWSDQKYGQAFSISACHDLLDVLKHACALASAEVEG